MAKHQTKGSEIKNRGQLLINLATVLLAAAAVLTILWATPWGAGLTDDSYYYIRPARDVLAGLPFEMNPHWPPFLSLVLTGLGFLGLEPLAGIRWLNAILMGANVLLAAAVVRRASGSAGFGLLAAALVFGSESLLEAHAWAMSEPLYFALALGCLLLLAMAVKRASWKILLGAALLAGLALLTRYAGLTLVGACGLAVLLYFPGRFERRLGYGLGFGILACLPMGIFVLHNLAASGQAVGYSGFNWSPPASDEIAQALYIVLLWFMPGVLARGREFLAAGGLALAGLAAGVLFWGTHRARFKETVNCFARPPLAGMLALFGLANLILLTLARGFNSPFDSRLLSPVNLSVLLLLSCLAAAAWPASGRTARTVILGVCLVLVSFYTFRDLDTLADFHTNGRGYASRYWYQSETVAFLKQNQPAQVISSAPFGVYFYTGQPTTSLYHQDVTNVRQFLNQPGSLLVLFDGMPPEIYGLERARLIQGLNLVQEFPDASVYQFRP